MSKYKILAICGKAGSGKDTLLKSVLDKNPQLNEIISCTTRPMREGEQEGVNYFYLTPEQFTQKVLDGEMLEATCFNDWFYGTSFDALRSNCVNIGVFNPEGIEALQAHSKEIDIVVYYVEATDKNRLLRQLNREENPDVAEIIRRYKADEIDFDELNFHYNAIENNTLSQLKTNTAIITAAATRLGNLN